jgi:tetratricopeptide (TPR) repeat protein
MKLETIARVVLLGVIFLLPLFVIPLAGMPLSFSKTAFFIVGTAVAFMLWAAARLRSGEVSFLHSGALVGLLFTVCAGALSTLASGAASVSWSGNWFDIGSFSFLLALAVFLFLITALFRSADHLFYAFFLFLASATVVFLFHVLRFTLGPEVFSFSFFTDIAATPLGRWNDVGVFFGAAGVFFLTTLEFMKVRAGLRALFIVGLAASLLMLAAANFTLVWLLLAAFALVFVVYLLSFKHLERAEYAEVRQGVEGKEVAEDTKEETHADTGIQVPLPPRKIPPISAVVCVVALMFVLFPQSLGGVLPERLGIAVPEARPSLGATLSIAKATLTTDPVLGKGSNLFGRAWLAFKPQGVNQTIFWNTDFTSGVGFLPTLLVTGGLAGVLAWLVFLAAYLFGGFRFILSERADKVARYLVGAPFLTSLFLWFVLFFYSPGPAVLALTFVFTGLALAARATALESERRVWRFAATPSFSFASVLVLVIVVLGSAGLVWSVGNRWYAGMVFVDGLRSANAGGQIGVVEERLMRAAERSPQDLFLRTLSEVMLARMNAVVQDSTKPADAVRAEFQELLGRAVGYAREAVALDGGYYLNWLSLGRVYEAVVPLRVEGAYEAAKAAYGEALARNPQSPAIVLILARLEAAKGDNKAAREFIVRALQAKSNYTEAVFLLSQLEVQEGNIAGAIQSVEAATVLSQNDPTLRFQLGLLKYIQRDYQGAVGAFERAVALNPNYANARYFLGLAYERLNRDGEAIAQFEELVRTNPANEEVALVLRNLKAGRAPFANAAPPVTATPEKRTELPVEEGEDE